MPDETADDQLQSFDSNAMPWGELYIDQLKLGVPLKAFISDPDTGMSVQMIKYAAPELHQPVAPPQLRPRHLRPRRHPDKPEAPRGRSAPAASSVSPKACSWSTAPPSPRRLADDLVHHQQALRHPSPSSFEDEQDSPTA